jgi:hypothetical protein
MRMGWVTSPYAHFEAASATGDQGEQRAIHGGQGPFSVVAEMFGEADVVVRIQGETDLDSGRTLASSLDKTVVESAQRLILDLGR